MSYTDTLSWTSTFTITHARHMAAKVSTDLKRIQRLYGSPSDTTISMYENEVIELMKSGCLESVTYGFQRQGKWIEPTLRYTARDLAGSSASDDDPGRVRPGADVTGTLFHSYLIYSAAWFNLSPTDKLAIQQRLPFNRQGAPEPGINGYLSNDRTYSAGGHALNRASVRSF